MKKTVICILCFVLVLLNASMYASTEENLIVESNLINLTIEELLDLRERIDSILQQKGHTIYFDLERGAKGEEVFRIQARLNELGYFNGINSGKFDTETQRAFKLFEKSNGLVSDGNASREDQILLFSAQAVARQGLEPSESKAAVSTVAPAENSTEFLIQVQSSWAANVGLNGVKLYTPYLKVLVTNQRGKSASKITLDVVFYNESTKEIWDDETYYLVGLGDTALKDGYSKRAFIKSSVGYQKKIDESILPTITAEISINGQIYETVKINNT